MNRCLVLWEFSSKQEYIFRSNKIKDNIGASLIMKSLSENFYEIFNQKFKDIKLEEENFIIKGGGKSLYLFEEEPSEKDFEKRVKNFIKEFSYMILNDYPGLDVVIVNEFFNDSNKINKNTISLLYDKLEKKKTQRKNSCHQVGFGIEVKCMSTGNLASKYYKEDDENICNESFVKRSFSKSKNGLKMEEGLKDLLPSNEQRNRYKLITSINEMIKNDAKSYIAVVHIDGNGMGKKFKEFSEAINLESDGEAKYIEALKEFSKSITEANKKAFKDMAEVIEKNKSKLKDYTNIEKSEFPLRPLILAGDDITYITAGVIGVETARVFIEKLEKIKINIQGKQIKLNACAGVAIVRNTYPYIKAYNLAEELCQNSKKFLLDQKLECSALDFHISQGDLNKSILDIRENNYKTEEIKDNADTNVYNLTMKPVLLKEVKKDDPKIYWRNYNNLIESYRNICNAVNNDDIGKNKIYKLKDAFRKGKTATENLMKFYDINNEESLKTLNHASPKSEYCFNYDDKTCMYLDAIEMLDCFIELEEEI